MSGSVIRNAIVDLRRRALRSAKRRRPLPSIESASTAASTMLTLLRASQVAYVQSAAAGAHNPVKEPAAARGGAAIRRVGGPQHRERTQVRMKPSTSVSAQ